MPKNEKMTMKEMKVNILSAENENSKIKTGERRNRGSYQRKIGMYCGLEHRGRWMKGAKNWKMRLNGSFGKRRFGK